MQSFPCTIISVIRLSVSLTIRQGIKFPVSYRKSSEEDCICKIRGDRDIPNPFQWIFRMRQGFLIPGGSRYRKKIELLIYFLDHSRSLADSESGRGFN